MSLGTGYYFGITLGIIIFLALPYYLIHLYYKKQMEKMVYNTQKFMEKFERIKQKKVVRRRLLWKKK